MSSLLSTNKLCWWSRTLSMARALCELQLELQCASHSSAEGGNNKNMENHKSQTEQFNPKTPVGKESKIKRGRCRSSKSLSNRFKEVKAAIESDLKLEKGSGETSDFFEETGNGNPILLESNSEVDLAYKTDSLIVPMLQSSREIGNFPSPRELAKVDEFFLAKRCGLGYRASRIVNLARSVAEGEIQLRELKEACSAPSLSNYDKLAEQLKEINGFGPVTCANVLMCMGFYHVIPTDSETVRHLKQVHARNSTIQTVQREVEYIYGKYAPFQFLAYWSEVWHFYEEWFGKMSEMPHANYKLITASNMRPNRKSKNKRIKTSLIQKELDP